MKTSILTLVLASLLGAAQALSAAGSSLLVVADELGDKAKYSQFWADLQARGFELTFTTPKSETPLFTHGERQFSHLLILPTKLKALGPQLTPQILAQFLQDEGNILLTQSAEVATPTTLTSLLLELDIHPAPQRDALLVDHFNYDAASALDKHDVLAVNLPSPARAGVKSFFGGDGILAVPRAAPHVLGNASPLLTPILSAPATAYAYSPKDDAETIEDLFASGAQLSVASAMQARNSARFTLLGSAEMLEDAWFGASVQPVGGKKVKTANREFAKALSGWAFKELGVLRVGRLFHYLSEDVNGARVNESSIAPELLSPKMYKINNEVTYNVELSEWATDKWIPYVPPTGDNVQLEFTMLSPYHRLNLAPVASTPETTVFGTSFKLPDQHGIFNFRLTYKRPFLTNVDEKRTVTVRHNAHDEWPRSFVISGAYPWIAGIWVTVAGWLFFVLVWLWSAPTDASRVTKKTQ